MKQSRLLYFFIAILMPFMLTGCSILLLPVQLVFFIFGAAMGMVSALAPLAAKMLPLLLFLVQTEPENTSGKLFANRFPFNFDEFDRKLAKQQYIAAYDPVKLLSAKLADNSITKNSFIFLFDAEMPPDIIRAKILKELKNRKASKIECFYVDGSVLFNNKYRFFVIMDKFNAKGALLKSFGSLNYCSDLYHLNGDRNTSLL